jgi:hypothetical protein
MPAPRGGWVIGRVLPRADGTPRFDAGRIVPEGRGESFVLSAASKGSAVLVLRTDGGAEGALRVTVERAGLVAFTREVSLAARRPDDGWHEIPISIGEIRRGDRVRLFAVRNALRDFHLWVIRE